MKGRIIILSAGLALAGPALAQDSASPQPQTVHAAVLRVDMPRLPPISRLDTLPGDLGFAGARLAIEDNDTTGRFMGQDFEAAEVTATPETAAAEMDKLLDQGVPFIVTLADDATTLALADQAGDKALVLNARARGDTLRGKDCRANVIHTAPSQAMLTDALAQFLVWKKWPNWFLVAGSHPDDIALADAYRRAATKFGAKIVEERTYEDTGGSRRSDSGHVQVQQQMPVFTQRAPAYDVLIAADENDVFANWLPYETWDARPVAGSAGLVPRSWAPSLEAWGAMQFQNRFEKLANRPIREEDYQTWVALRMIGEAATRTQSTDATAIREFMLSDKFEVAGFKGQKLTVRDWDHQLRQPILLATPAVTASVSPQDQYLHQTSALDTLGIDRPETECKF
ncbi:ABC transporter, substrate binding protein, PQQ-dependent alcohol dehydrogenase system [Paracoccus aminovorans]|uniref:ABC transporter, substrate binding protein, PQQ-dependent alcohol dehydrogenase system n=1 Tax=Paracoccus aminovorans TaxID=34004 RepID=A0A1I3BDJ2_9RHOB|nr:ABC transporter substrate-binding protein [Paracoccus aminovorans]CQR84777.1 putative ABC transporter substrate-binding protein [Paracoccus aminovorans]SFH60377.1 ABC transporter, substrate binding protein, PQQ-dependent alcohol dehydrogenase system [Paracoccus aminovorans]